MVRFNFSFDICFVCLFWCLILFVLLLTVFQSCPDDFLSFWVEPVLLKQEIKYLAQGHNTVTPPGASSESPTSNPLDPKSNALPTEPLHSTFSVQPLKRQEKMPEIILAKNDDGPLKWTNGPYPIQIHANFKILMGHLKFLWALCKIWWAQESLISTLELNWHEIWIACIWGPSQK